MIHSIHCKIIIFFIYGLSILHEIHAQEKSIIVNQGIFSIMPDTEVSMEAVFENNSQGKLNNNGTIYYYSHFRNEGLYTFDAKLKSSYAVFQPQIIGESAQLLSGTAPSEFCDVLFNSPVSVSAFELQNDMSIAGKANFKSGVVRVDSLMGMLAFEPGAQAINVSDRSHARGLVEKIGRESFVYPIGDQGIYRPALISAPPLIQDSFIAKYYLKNSDSNQPHSSRAGAIELIDNREYWTLERAASESSIILSLSWDERTTSENLLGEAVSDLRILRWDADQKLWVDEGGIVDLDAKTVTSPTVVKGFGIFTLGTVKKDLVMQGDVVIYNSVSPNGDGQNDYFRIDNIQRFPNNTVEIYNRWGVKVYETKHYDSDGNVFQGISQGRVSVNTAEKLPTGTYYYILNYEYQDPNGSRMIKKAGYLHLENN